MLDRVLLQERHNLLVASVGFRRRSVPLAWQTLDHVGASDLEEHKAVLKAALAELPVGTKVTVLADSEFRSVALFQWLRRQGHDALLGIRGRTYIYDTAQRGCAGRRIHPLPRSPSHTSRVHLHFRFLPGYAPELNPDERIWQ